MQSGTPATHQNALPLGSRLLEYRLDAVLGAGGFGITYLAHDLHLEKKVAIKEFLPADLAVRVPDGSLMPVNSERRQDYNWGLGRFLDEARTLARFSHPNIVRVLRYFEANATGYMVMEYEDGVSLAQWLREHPQPPEDALRKLLMPLLDGLEAVHGAGFLHRDIKPPNVFVRGNGQPVLLDFGAARIATGASTRTLTAVLTPGYAPLEQYTSDGEQGPWSDIYALAGVLYRAVTMQNPADAVSRMKHDPVAARLQAQAGRYSAPFLGAVEWGMQLEERGRPQSVAAWREAFAAGVQTIGLRADPPAATLATTVASVPRPPRRRWVVGVGVLLVAGVAGLWAMNHVRTRLSATPHADALPEVAALLERADANRDGVLDRSEVEGKFPRIAEKFSAIDTDRSGTLSRDELEAARRHELSSQKGKAGPGSASDDRVAARARGEFLAADADGDGQLSRAEVRGRFPHVERQFDAVDTDRDGRISMEEFVTLRRHQAQAKQ